MIKEAYEDWNRRKQDKEINHTITHVLRDEKLISTTWDAVNVGDIVKITENESVPADLLILATSSSDGSAYIETANLDGYFY